MYITVEGLLERKGRSFWTISPHASVQSAVELLGERGIGAVLVCEGEKLNGILSERDCVRRVLWRERSARETSVAAVMTREVVCVAPEDSIEHCMRLMNTRRIRHLPVTKQERVVGMVSMRDVVHTLLNDKEHTIEELEGYISGSPSARPPQPH